MGRWRFPEDNQSCWLLVSLSAVLYLRKLSNEAADFCKFIARGDGHGLYRLSGSLTSAVMCAFLFIVWLACTI